MESILSQIISNYNFNFIFSVNIITYLIIQLSSKKIFAAKWFKIVVTIIVSGILGVVYHFISNTSTEVLVNSAIFAPLAWDWVFKPFLSKIGIDYKDKE